MNKITINFKNAVAKYRVFLKWAFISTFVGVVVGLIGTAFHYVIELSVEFRHENQWVLFLLPVAGIIIVLTYKLLKMENDLGTNLVFLAIHKNEKISIKTAPLIFIGTVLTHLCGGSSGREGAALQIGASISSSFSKIFRLDEKDKKIITMCGMSACFAAVFGTPITAIVFAMEVFSVGVMYYAALLPCTISAILAFEISKFFGVSEPHYSLLNIPDFSVLPTLKTIALAIACAMLGIVFCIILKKTGKLYKKIFKNNLVRIIAGGVFVIALTFIVGNYSYNGAGMSVIENAIKGEARPEAFILKIIFTALTLGAGYKGGEIVPVFFTGATFGNTFGGLLGLSPSFGAGIGLCSLFCAVTNCPLTSIMLSIELFGIESLPLFVIAIAISYMLSGYYGLYSSQRIMYSKTKTEFIDTNSI